MTRRITAVQAIQPIRRIPAQLIALCDDGTVLRMLLADERWMVLPDAPQPEPRAAAADGPAVVEYDLQQQAIEPVRWWGK